MYPGRPVRRKHSRSNKTDKRKNKDQIAAAPEEFYPDYEGLLELSNLESRWYISETGFCIYYIPYELAGYSKGVLTYSIPLGDLNSYLLFNPAYISFAE